MYSHTICFIKKKKVVTLYSNCNTVYAYINPVLTVSIS